MCLTAKGGKRWLARSMRILFLGISTKSLVKPSKSKEMPSLRKEMSSKVRAEPSKEEEMLSKVRAESSKVLEMASKVQEVLSKVKSVRITFKEPSYRVVGAYPFYGVVRSLFIVRLSDR